MNPVLLNGPAGGGAPDPAPGAASGLMADLRSGGGAPAAGAAEGELILAPRRKPRMNIQTLVTVLMIVASGASLFMMRKQGTRAGVKFENVKLDIEPDKTTRLTPEQEKILRQLADNAAGPAAPADHLDKNPFKLEEGAAVIPGVESPAPDAARQEEIRQALATLQVNAVMEGPVPVARLNNQLVKVGDTVADIFTVADIRDRSVDLTVDGRTFTVSMAEMRTGGNPPPNRPQPQRMPNFGPPMEPRR
jgi:hypothetical protein